MNFNDLKIVDKVEVKSKSPVSTPTINKVINYQELTEDKPIVSVKLTKDEIERRRTTEPGYKVPSGNYQQVGQWCEVCQDVQTHAHLPEKNKLRCLNCKNDKIYGK